MTPWPENFILQAFEQLNSTQQIFEDSLFQDRTGKAIKGIDFTSAWPFRSKMLLQSSS